MERIVLLNPPGRRTYLRDYYCSKSSQADYVNHPVDLLFLSGHLRHGFELHAVDAIVERLSPEPCRARVATLRPDVVVGLCGSVSWPEDEAFYRTLHRETGARIVLGGDLLVEDRARRLRALPFVEAFVHDFAAPDLARYLSGHDPAGLHNLTVRAGRGILETPVDRPRGTTFSVPVPRHDLFVDKPYRYPFVRARRFATVLTDFGCPYRCTFCVMATLGWRWRPVPEVLEELREITRLGIREIFVLDQTFGIPRARAMELLDGLARFPGLGWTCFTRPDVIDDAELVAAMRTAGCHTVILGLETGSQALLDSVSKDTTRERVEAGFARCREAGLTTVATVLLGLPGEDRATFRDTLAFLRRVDPDFASFNVAVPRMGTPFRRTALERGLTDAARDVMDQSGRPVAMPTGLLSAAEVRALRRRAVREFYFRPGYVGRRLRRLAAPGGGLGLAWRQARQGAHLARALLTG